MNQLFSVLTAKLSSDANVSIQMHFDLFIFTCLNQNLYQYVYSHSYPLVCTLFKCSINAANGGITYSIVIAKWCFDLTTCKLSTTAAKQCVFDITRVTILFLWWCGQGTRGYFKVFNKNHFTFCNGLVDGTCTYIS